MPTSPVNSMSFLVPIPTAQVLESNIQSAVRPEETNRGNQQPNTNTVCAHETQRAEAAGKTVEEAKSVLNKMQTLREEAASRSRSLLGELGEIENKVKNKLSGALGLGPTQEVKDAIDRVKSGFSEAGKAGEALSSADRAVGKAYDERSNARIALLDCQKGNKQ